MDAASGPSVERVGEPGFGRLSRDSLVYSLGAFAGKAAALILVPILTRVLSTDDFGRLDVLSALTSALISVLLLGLDTAALRQFFALDDEGERSELVTTLLLLLLICTVPVCVVIVVLRSSISDWLFGTTSLDNGVALVSASVLGGIVLFGAQAVLRMERRPSGFAAVETLSLGAQAALVIVLVYAWERSVVAVMIGYALSNLFAALLGVWLVRHRLRRPRFRPRAAVLLRAALPLVPGLVAMWGADFAHRAILLHNANATEVAYFSVAVRFGSVGMLAATGYQLAWQPQAFARRGTTEDYGRLATEARRIATAVASCVCALAILSPELVRLVGGTKYDPALAAIAWSLVFALFFTLFQVTSMPSSLAQTFGDIGLATTVGVAVAVVGNFALAGSFGATGTSAAVAGGQAVAVAVVWYRGRHRTAARLPWAHLLGTMIVATAIVLIAGLPTGGASPLVRSVLAVGLLTKLVVDGSVSEVIAFLRRFRSRRATRR